MIEFISHSHREEMRVVVSSSQLEQGTLKKHSYSLAYGISLQLNTKQVLQAHRAENKSFPHPRTKQNGKCCLREVLTI